MHVRFMCVCDKEGFSYHVVNGLRPMWKIKEEKKRGEMDFGSFG